MGHSSPPDATPALNDDCHLGNKYRLQRPNIKGAYDYDALRLYAIQTT